MSSDDKVLGEATRALSKKLASAAIEGGMAAAPGDDAMPMALACRALCRALAMVIGLIPGASHGELLATAWRHLTEDLTAIRKARGENADVN